MTEQEIREQVDRHLSPSFDPSKFWPNYVRLAVRTAAPAPTKADDREHAQWGIITELGEVVDNLKRQRFYGQPTSTNTQDNLVEEFGDLLWYFALLDHAVDGEGIVFMPDVQLFGSTPFDCSRRILNSIEKASPRPMGELHELARLCRVDIVEAARRNIIKLWVRFPNSFTAKAAAEENRDREAEAALMHTLIKDDVQPEEPTETREDPPEAVSAGIAETMATPMASDEAPE